MLFSITRNGQTGYIDKTGKIIIEPQFDGNTEEFPEGLAPIRIDTDGIPHHGKFGFIDTAGKIVIQPQFDEVSPFSEGLASIRVGGSHGYIDKSGQTVIESPDFQNASNFTEGLAAVVRGGKFGSVLI